MVGAVARRTSARALPGSLRFLSASMSLVQLELDEADKENFQALQSQISEAQSEMALVSHKLRTRNAEGKHAQLTLAELSTMPDSTRSFEQLGKMFIIKPMATLKSELTERVEACKKDCLALEEKRTSVEAALKKVNDDFQEFVKAHAVEQGDDDKAEKAPVDAA